MMRAAKRETNWDAKNQLITRLDSDENLFGAVAISVSRIRFTSKSGLPQSGAQFRP